jgi:S-DNA-T family DNA segregation ATPase FtsK/SpoIIIE
VTTTLRHLGGPGAGDHQDHPAATVLVGAGTSEAGELASRLDDGVGTVVVDDAHLLAGTPVEDVVLEWATRTGGRLLVGGDVEACANLYRGLVPHVARGRTGVVLQPSSAQHGALLGVRLNPGDLKVPGRGLLVERGHCTRIQVAGP